MQHISQIAHIATWLLLCLPLGAQAQDPKLLAKDRLFKLQVEGVKDEKKDEDEGTAFVAAGGVDAETSTIVTARHVVGDIDDWDINEVEGRLPLPNRTVTVFWVSKFGFEFKSQHSDKTFITSAPLDTIDAAKITVEKGFEPYSLNGCVPAPGEQLRVLRWAKGNLEVPEFFSVEAIGHTPTEYGEFFIVRDKEASLDIESANSGAPVFNSDDQVVGLVSGTGKDGSVLVTLVKSFQSLLPEGTEGPCLSPSGLPRLEVVGDDRVWRQGTGDDATGPIQLMPASEGICALAEIRGRFTGDDESVTVHTRRPTVAEGGGEGLFWFIEGSSGHLYGDVSARAVCFTLVGGR